MASAAKGKTSRVLVWILLALLILGLAGFGVDSFGRGVRAVGEVGDREISTRDYARALQQELRAFEAQVGQSIPFATAQALGIDRMVRQRLVTLAALDNEAARIGLSVGDEAVRRELLAIRAFRGLDGSFDREAYRFTLQQNGYSEAEFEAEIRADSARTLLQAAIMGGVAAPEAWTEAVFAWAGERRSFRWIRLETPSAPLPEPDEATLRAFHAEHAADYSLPEGRRVGYVWLTPAMLVDRVTVDEQAIRDLYDRRIAEFVQPERRLVERLVFATEAEAEAAMERVRADPAAFDALVAERGLTLTDVDMGDVTREELGPAGEAVFALEAPGVVGPLPSPLGPALFRMNGILAAQETPYEAAREELRAELAMERARRQIAERAAALADLLAGGATLEDLARDEGLEQGEILLRPDTTEGIAAYASFRAAAAALTPGAFPEVTELDDGGIAVLRLEEIVPAEQQPFEAVAERVRADWTAAERARLLAAEAEALVAELSAGGSPEAAGLPPGAVEAVGPLARDGFVEGLPREAVAAVFAMAPGELRAVPAGGAVHVLLLDAVAPPDPAEPDQAALRGALAGQAAQSAAQDLFELFAVALETEAGIRFDERAIAAVHAQFP